MIKWRLSKLLVAVAAVPLLLSASARPAEAIFIEITGLELFYDDANDALVTPAGGSSLTGIFVYPGNDNTDPPIYIATQPPSDLDAFVDIPGVTVLPAPGTSANTTGGFGIFDIIDNTGGFVLQLDLFDPWLLSGAAGGVGSTQYLLSGLGSSSDIFAQNIPGGFMIGTPVNITFSVQSDSITDPNFGGTANEQGPSIPEPATMMLLGLGLVGVSARLRARRRRS